MNTLRQRFFDSFAPGARRISFVLALSVVCFLFAFPVLWLILTSFRPESGVYYVYRGLDFTLGNFVQVFANDRLVQAFINSAIIATFATIFSILVTVSSGYMLSRFRGPIASGWFGVIYALRTVPFVTWVLPLYFVEQRFGLYDSYVGLLLPHIAVHICFFSWLMKGFFD
ncbi:MAG: hypothetical protein NUV75_12545, partial [Gallionella sp.]|nr:hypothetical protein [Gallionella sp.]